jgi:hypothetical protein
LTLTQSERDDRRRRRRRSDLSRWALLVAVVLVVFGLGIAIGQALHDNPKPGGTISFERTFSVPSVPPGSTATP